jgi:hypothetical protein
VKPYDEMTDEELEADDRARQAARFRPVERVEASDGHMFMMMTCPGREESFDRSRKSLGFSGGPYPTSFVSDNKLQGQAETFFRALRKAAVWPGMRYLTLFEDDVVAAKNARKYIATTKFPEGAVMVSWFHRLVPMPLSKDARWMFEPAQAFAHQQAVTFPAATVHALWASPQLKNWSEPHGADALIGLVMPEAKVAYHFPNIVDHVGGNASMVGNTGARDSLTFVGEAFDALDLTRHR